MLHLIILAITSKSGNKRPQKVETKGLKLLKLTENIVAGARRKKSWKL